MFFCVIHSSNVRTFSFYSSDVYSSLLIFCVVHILYGWNKEMQSAKWNTLWFLVAQMKYLSIYCRACEIGWFLCRPSEIDTYFLSLNWNRRDFFVGQLKYHPKTWCLTSETPTKWCRASEIPTDSGEWNTYWFGQVKVAHHHVSSLLYVVPLRELIFCTDWIGTGKSYGRWESST